MINKHETIACERCHGSFECKANSSSRCQCTEVDLMHEEAAYISECFDTCLCSECLKELKEEYQMKTLNA